ncbi:MAG TPA: non-homologous end-joining DNA ligase [Candidatus Binatia bacterium]|nr:non-homologous end-joining DNA ligase [Candidatus Binatia bacterium]
MAKKHKAKFGARELDLSNLDKVMYPGSGFTKGQVIDYYARVSRYLLPHLKDRPITQKRYPDGVRGAHFYEKNAPSFTPDWIKRFAIPRTERRGVINYILINDLPTLIWSANMANLEMHPFLAQAPRIDMPTMIVFDLDPGEGADILDSSEAAFLVKAVLDRLKLKSFPKVSGSKGIHLHVPLNTPVTYEAVQPFAQSIAQLLQTEHPQFIVSEMAKAKRNKKVFVDWSQNSEHKSTVAVYSLRAKGDTPFVAMPVTWEELRKAQQKGDPSVLFFDPEAALTRLDRIGDLFAPVLQLKQKLPRPFLDLQPATEQKANEPANSLHTYRQKRDFNKTSEPAPAMPRRGHADNRLFVIQKHAASRLHYDFRLAMDGVLKSWAVPKGPPYEANQKRLAMATEDHPMEYARFEGTIPKGEYGGGTVMVWDIGTYEVLDGNYWKGKLHLLLRGEKLQGEWVLVKRAMGDRSDNSWLMIKAAGTHEPPSDKDEDASALTGRSMQEIAGAGDAVWHSNRSNRKDAIEEPASIPPSLQSKLAALPDTKAKFIKPMLAEAVHELPHDRKSWIYELKLDGYRCVAVKSARHVQLFSRNQNLFNAKFPTLMPALSKIESETVLDGEIVALDDKGRPSFNILQNSRVATTGVYFYVFDLLIYRGKNLLKLPVEQRRALLPAAIRWCPDSVRVSADLSGTAKNIVQAAKKLGLEGIIAKQKGSVYESDRRSGAWVKYRINQGQELVIGGYIPGPQYFDALLVGYYQRGDLIFIAKIRNGFVPRLRRELFEKFKGLETTVCPFANLPEPKNARRGLALTAEAMKQCRWLEPKLVAQIEFTEWTDGDRLRHSRFAGLREDKNPQEVTREVAA